MSQGKILPENTTVAQLIILFPVFYGTCWFITISTTAWLTPSHLISLAQLSSVFTCIHQGTTSLLQLIYLVHFKHHADTTK